MIAAAGIVAAFQIGKLPAALPVLRAELGLSLVEAAWIVSALAAVGVATGMVWGFVADRFGHRRMLLCGMAVIVLGTALGSFAETGTELFATRLVEGCGYVTVLTAGPTVIGAFCRERDRPMALGLWAFYMPVGLAGMTVISPAMIEAASWRGLWQLNGLLGARRHRARGLGHAGGARLTRGDERRRRDTDARRDPEDRLQPRPADARGLLRRLLAGLYLGRGLPADLP